MAERAIKEIQRLPPKVAASAVVDTKVIADAVASAIDTASHKRKRAESGSASAAADKKAKAEPKSSGAGGREESGGGGDGGAMLRITNHSTSQFSLKVASVDTSVRTM